MMTDERHIQVLLVEDDPADAQALAEIFVQGSGVQFALNHVGLLSDAIEALGKQPYDIILLNLELPDSCGIGTFTDIHENAPHVPVLVLTGREGDALAEAAMSQGALDYLVKQQLQAPLLTRCIRYAVDRARLQQQLAETRLRAQQASEINSVERLSEAKGTSITARLYSGGPLRETAPPQFQEIVRQYGRVLDVALEDRVHGETDGNAERLHDMAAELGFLRAKPRDVIEVHTTTLRKKTQNAPWEKAQAYLEESRLTALELMGNLANHYRSLCVSPIGKEGEDE